MKFEVVKMVEITWLGHACFLITGSRKVLIDPFLSGNPTAAKKPEEVEAEFILVTHGHGDHLGDAELIAKKCNAKLICIYELSRYFAKKGVDSIGMNIGGTANFEGVSFTMVPAVHSADVEDGGEMISAGNPVGFIISMDGVRIYHTGDTFVFSDMQLISKLYKPEIMLLPIGGFYTMGVEEAYRALQLVKPKVAIPMHYNTFPVIQQDPEKFKKLVESKLKVRVVALKPGESLKYP